MNTPRQPRLASSTDSGPSPFLKQLLDEIHGTRTPTVACDGKTLRSGPRPRISRDTERRGPSVWVGGTAFAQDARQKLRAADEARLKNTNALNGNHGLRADVLPSSPRPRPHLSRLKTMLPAPSNDEAAHSSSPLTCSESGLSSTTSHSESAASALTVSSTNATAALSCGGCNGDGPPVMFGHPTSTRFVNRLLAHKRERSLDDAECEVLPKKMRSTTSPTAGGLVVPASSSPHLAMAFQNRFDDDDGEHVCEEGFSADGMLIHTPTQHQLAASPSPHDAPSAKQPRPTTPAASAPLDAPETPIFARPFHLFDTSVSRYRDGRGDTWMHDVSIYKSTHGDGWAESSLCEHCFRQRSLFSRIRAYGYETCGRETCLDEYYWEPGVRPGCE